jgi:hypothetical protein
MAESGLKDAKWGNPSGSDLAEARHSDRPVIGSSHSLVRPRRRHYQRAANTLRRLLSTLGLQRRQRDVTPTLTEYLQKCAEINGEAAE